MARRPDEPSRAPAVLVVLLIAVVVGAFGVVEVMTRRLGDSGRSGAAGVERLAGCPATTAGPTPSPGPS